MQCKAKTSGRLRQEDLEFKVSLHHVLNSRLCELYGVGLISGDQLLWGWSGDKTVHTHSFGGMAEESPALF